MEEPEQTYVEEPPRTQQVDKEGRTSEADLSSEKSFCSSCGLYYGERQSESYADKATGTPYTPPQEEKDEVLVMQDMLEHLLNGSLESNRRAKVQIDKMIDELLLEGVRKYLPKLRPRQEEDY